MRAREASIRHRSGHLVRADEAFTMLTVRAGTDIPGRCNIPAMSRQQG